MKFRVHYEYNDEKSTADITAGNPQEANSILRKKFDNPVIIHKTKLVRE